MNLCIDAGNTFIKAALFDNDVLKEKHLFENYETLLLWLKSKEISKAIICSVKGDEHIFIEKYQGTVEMFNYKMPLPVVNTYKTPDTLGKDRLASAIGAKNLFPRKNCLVIDAGTCVTYDIINSDGEYIGGAISPGMTMRFKALNLLTARLPLLTPQAEVPFTGKDTHSGIRSGIQNGLLFEIEGTIEEYRRNYPDLQVILCGGDSDFFESKIKGVIFAFPDLVLIGLNYSLLYNAHR